MATHHLTESNSGEHITVEAGDIIIISLAETPTTGFRWTVTEQDEEQIQLIAEDFALHSGSGTGGGGRKMIRLQVLQKRPGAFKLVNKQVGSGDIDRRFEISYS